MPGKRERLQRARKKAPSLRADGVSVSEIARRAGVSRQTVYRWLRWSPADDYGDDSPVQRRPQLTAEELHALDQALMALPTHYGLTGKRWTLKLVAKLLSAKPFEVFLSLSQISRVINAELPFGLASYSKRALASEQNRVRQEGGELNKPFER